MATDPIAQLGQQAAQPNPTPAPTLQPAGNTPSAPPPQPKVGAHVILVQNGHAVGGLLLSLEQPDPASDAYYPPAQIAFIDLKQKTLLASADWREAIERATTVKHVTDKDAEQRHYLVVPIEKDTAPPAPPPPSS